MKVRNVRSGIFSQLTLGWKLEREREMWHVRCSCIKSILFFIISGPEMSVLLYMVSTLYTAGLSRKSGLRYFLFHICSGISLGLADKIRLVSLHFLIPARIPLVSQPAELSLEHRASESNLLVCLFTAS